MIGTIIFAIIIGILGIFFLYYSYRYTSDYHEKNRKSIEKLRKSQMREFDLSKERLSLRMPYWYNKIFFLLAGIMIICIDFFIWYSGVFNLYRP
ncbi:hypothetical protein BIV60_18005 [Bacillus sp. MUM 116]|nr:hypothetical protein BIV60_18005 [Bacillus sp. MUM 116]